jgi:hypothetical protein
LDVRSRISFLSMLRSVVIVQTASAQTYAAAQPRQHFVTIGYDWLYTH